ncbi:hypothetical protein DDZ13_08880 [Coraliomargarita sinensis]|uniref:Uncharacterized protein n=1 Tax=Coraliomargarita sinensis TaxID=2174842 RepID=A0A317ZIU5_9BACT|nr:hypothetical protein [Coraliomargarita sinensis]PXA04143.1 hypothetical protein DDZ13_08880 [Coraliomargarita sinensis]
MFITYGRSWRGSNEIRLREVAKRAGSKVRIVLPDYRDAELLKHFSVRYRKTEEEVANLIKDAVKEYSDYFDEETCDFKLRLTKHPPTNGYYRFGNRQIITLYNYNDQKGNIPVFVNKKPGRLFDFFDFEFDYLISSGSEPPTEEPTSR